MELPKNIRQLRICSNKFYESNHQEQTSGIQDKGFLCQKKDMKNSFRKEMNLIFCTGRSVLEIKDLEFPLIIIYY